MNVLFLIIMIAMIPVLRKEIKWRKETQTSQCPGYFVHPDHRIYPVYAHEIMLGKSKGADLRTWHIGLDKKEQRKRLVGTDYYHAYVKKADGEFSVKNISKRKELVVKRNGSDVRLFYGQTERLEDGDKLFLGNYILMFRKGTV